MKNILKYIISIVLMGSMFGCLNKFEEYNSNQYEPDKVPPVLLLNTMFETLASPQQNTCQMNNTMWACFSGHITAPNNWGKGFNLFAYFNATEEWNESTTNDLFTKIYSTLYRIEDLTQKRGIIYSIAQLTRVHAMQIVTTLQGPLPYSQMAAGKTSVAYDNEETAWRALFNDLNAAIAVIKVGAEAGVSSQLAAGDQFYAGDCRKWLKFANTLKLRMAIRISGISPDFAREMAAEAVRDGVMDSIDDSAYDNTNSGQANNGFSIIDSWGEVRANACLVSYMNGYDDPRRAAYFTQQTYDKNGGYIGVRSGTTTSPSAANYEGYSRLMIATDGAFPQPVMYASEAAFLRAEGALKGWEAEMNGSAQQLYEEGIRLAFAEFKMGGADLYLSNSKLTPGDHIDLLSPNDNFTNQSSITIQWNNADSNELKLERILTQKWIANYLNPIEGWADFRRTGYPKIFPPTKSMSQDGVSVTRQQRRLHFAQKEYNNNGTETTAAVALLNGGVDSDAADLWWALKSNGQY